MFGIELIKRLVMSNTKIQKEPVEDSWQLRLAKSMAIGFAIVFIPVLLILLIGVVGNFTCWVFGGVFCPTDPQMKI